MSKPPRLSLGSRLLLASQAMAPLAVKVGLVQQLGARTAALVAPHMPAEQLHELVLALPSSFTAQVIQHIEPQWVLAVYLSLPDSLHLAVARELCAQDLYPTAAAYAECLPARRLRALIFGLDPDAVLRIARHIQNIALIIESLRGFSSSFLCQLTEAAVRADNLEIALQVIAGLSPARQADICATLPPVVLQKVLPGLLAQSGEALYELLPERLQDYLDART